MEISGVVVIFVLFASVYAQDAKTQDPQRFIIVESLLNRLRVETWSQDETACILDVESLLDGVKNNTLWASWAWDSMQFPMGTFYGNVYHFGNFDQCLAAPFESQSSLSTQYCLVDVKLTELNDYDGEADPYGDADRYIGRKFRYGQRLNTVHLGVCLPASCQAESVAKVSRIMFGLSHLPVQEVAVDPRDCQVAGATMDVALGFYVLCVVLLTMAGICLLTYIVKSNEENSNSTVSEITRCFCLSRNFDSLFEVGSEDISMLHGTRGLTSLLLVVGHYWFLKQFVAVLNKTDAEKSLTSHPVVQWFIHPDLLVDTFFLMSGLLYFKGLMTNKSYQPIKTLFKRYIRLIVPLGALNIFVLTYVIPHIGSGPAWPRLVRSIHGPCARAWWGNFLMYDNQIEDIGHCSEVGWYIKTDFQLTILATGIFIVYRMHKKIGLILFGLAYITTIVLPTIWTYLADLPGVLLYDFGESQSMKTNIVYNTVYQPIYTRGSSYIIGMALGYAMSLYQPQKHRKIIAKNVSIAGFIIGMSLLACGFYVGSLMFRREMSDLSIAFFSAFDKTIWCTGIAVIILVCEYGTLPITNDFLSSTVLVPLSKLSYCNYLFHIIIVYRSVFNLRTPATYDAFTLLIHGLGHAVISFAGSYLVWLFVEAPITNLINLAWQHKRYLLDYRPVNKIYGSNEPAGDQCRMIDGYKIIGFSTMPSLVSCPTECRSVDVTSRGGDIKTDSRSTKTKKIM